MPIKKLKNYLDENNIEYITIRHSLAFNAQRVAATNTRSRERACQNSHDKTRW